MWFGRGRVQDRAVDSDERHVTHDPSARPSSTPSADSAPDPDAASQHSGWVDDKVLSSAVPNDNGRAIDALRAPRPRLPKRTHPNRQSMTSRKFVDCTT